MRVEEAAKSSHELHGRSWLLLPYRELWPSACCTHWHHDLMISVLPRYDRHPQSLQAAVAVVPFSSYLSAALAVHT